MTAPSSLPAPVPAAEAGGIVLWGMPVRTVEQALAVCRMLADTEFVPAPLRGKPGAVFAAIQYGAEVGLTPVQSLQHVAIINGRPSLWGDAVLALVLGSGTVTRREEPTLEQVAASGRAEVRYWRRGYEEPFVGVMSREMAQARQVWEKGSRSTLWAKWERGVGDTASMLLWRARHQAWRAGWADVLKGLTPVEIARDYDDVGETADGVTIQRPRATADAAAAPPDPWNGVERAADLVAPARPRAAASAPSPTPPPAPVPAPAATPAEAAAPQVQTQTQEQGQAVRCRIVEMRQRQGSTAGKAWTLYVARASDGQEYSTFDRRLAEDLRAAGGEEIDLRWTTNARGHRQIVGFLPVGLAEADLSDAAEPPKEPEAQAESLFE